MKEIREQVIERYMLSVERIRSITEEETTEAEYRTYFRKVAEFILQIDEIHKRMERKSFWECSLEELKEENKAIYADITGDQITIQAMRILNMQFRGLEKKSDVS